ncbi:MAG: major facilitator superfamily 1 [Defluviitaleaceae bacterium]|nr:major facilitator superfamily 1 [Defluviitaleaceae bacterium]
MDIRENQEFVEKHLKKNMILSTLDGVTFCFGSGMVPLATTIVYFISYYIQNNILIGLLTTMSTVLINFPQIFMANYIESKPNDLKVLSKISLLQRVPWFFMGLSVFLIKDSRWMIFSIYVIYGLYSLFTGLSNVTWNDMMAKIIPIRLRGRFFGIRTAITSGAEFIGSLLCVLMLSFFDFPYNYGAIFILVGCFMMISYIALMQTKEPDFVRNANRQPFIEYAKDLLTILKEDKNFTFAICSIGLATIGTAAANFRIVYAKTILPITPKDVAFLTALWLISRSLFSIFWGIVADKKGYKITMMGGYFIYLISYLCMNLISGMNKLYFVFILHGAGESVVSAIQANFIISLGGEDKRATYLGLAAILFTPLSAIGPVLMGLLIDGISYQAAFLAAAILTAGMILTMHKKVHC